MRSDQLRNRVTERSVQQKVEQIRNARESAGKDRAPVFPVAQKQKRKRKQWNEDLFAESCSTQDDVSDESCAFVRSRDDQREPGRSQEEPVDRVPRHVGERVCGEKEDDQCEWHPQRHAQRSFNERRDDAGPEPRHRRLLEPERQSREPDHIGTTQRDFRQMQIHGERRPDEDKVAVWNLSGKNAACPREHDALVGGIKPSP